MMDCFLLPPFPSLQPFVLLHWKQALLPPTLYLLRMATCYLLKNYCINIRCQQGAAKLVNQKSTYGINLLLLNGCSRGTYFYEAVFCGWEGLNSPSTIPDDYCISSLAVYCKSCRFLVMSQMVFTVVFQCLVFGSSSCFFSFIWLTSRGGIVLIVFP